MASPVASRVALSRNRHHRVFPACTQLIFLTIPAGVGFSDRRVGSGTTTTGTTLTAATCGGGLCRWFMAGGEREDTAP